LGFSQSDYFSVPSAPQFVSLELNQSCNLRCVHCRVAETETPEALKLSEIRQLIDELADMKVFKLGLTGGEVFLRKDIYDIMAYAADRGLRFSITTNGTLLSRRIIERLSETGAIEVLQISIDGASDETHDFIRNKKGVFNAAINAAKSSIERGLRTGLITTAMKINLDEIPRILELALRIGAHAYSARRFMPVGRGIENINELELSPEQYRGFLTYWNERRYALKNKIELIIEEPLLILVDQKGFSISELFLRGCKAARTYCAVWANGDVVPCMFAPIRAGNIRQQSLEEIWRTSNVFTAIRDPNKLEGRCGACEYKFSCRGCRAMAFLHYGDIFAEDYTCWHIPKASCKIERC
jgi:radical SAM protein with 4Fe4S-binding SPASM domain